MGMATRVSWKTRAAGAGEELRRAAGAGGLLRAVQCAARLLLGAALSGAEIFGGCAPFGVALVGASGSGLEGLCALIGAVLGYLGFQGFGRGLRYVSAAALTFSAAFAFYDARLYKKQWFMPAVAAAMSAVTGFVYLSERGWRTEEVIFFATEVLLTGACVYFYRLALGAWSGREESGELTLRQLVSLMILGGTALITLAKAEPYGGISLGRVCAAAAVMCFARGGGLGLGAAVGVAAGVSMDLAAGEGAYYTMAYALAGVMAGVFGRKGRMAAALGYVLTNAVAVLWMWSGGVHLSLLYEVFIASILFLLLPERLMGRIGMLAVRERDSGGDSRSTGEVQRQLGRMAQAFRTLQSTLWEMVDVPLNDADAATLFDRTADRVCRGCALRGRCWQREYATTYNALNDALPAMLERGRGQAGDFPEHFRGRCMHFPEFLAAANEELRGLLYRREYQSRLRESRETVSGQYQTLAEVLERAAELTREVTPDPARERKVRQYLAAQGVEAEAEVCCDRAGRFRAELAGRGVEQLEREGEAGRLERLLGLPLTLRWEEDGDKGRRLILTQAEPLVAAAGAAARQKDGQTVSGDTGAWFKREDGRLFALLCDGMGTGSEAAEESTLAARLLEQFLQAGVAAPAALRTVSSSLGLRGEATGGFTTVDLLEVDLFTGEAAVYKYGAAPTYLKRRGTVSRLAGGSSLPAGVSVGAGGGADVVRFRLEAGDRVVLVSDGVSDGEDDGWLREALAGETSPRELARTLVEESGKRLGAGDDKTALVLHLERRSPRGEGRPRHVDAPTLT